MRKFFEKYREQITGYGAVVLVFGVIGIGIWGLIRMNSGQSFLSGGGSGEEGKKGEITHGLIDGKDYGTDYKEDEEAIFEVLVVIRDQKADDPEIDKKESLKRGDVIAVRKSPHLWSDTEKASYLTLKIEMTGKMANELLAPKKDGENIVMPRAKKIDLEKAGFTGEQISGGQPLQDKEFGREVIIER